MFEIAAGILNKIVPQINIFVINIQLKVIVSINHFSCTVFTNEQLSVTGVIKDAEGARRGIDVFIDCVWKVEWVELADDTKNEKATPKKRRDERKEGNVFSSKDIIAVASLRMVL